MSEAKITALYVHPIKGAAGVAVQSAQMTKTGLRFDREWMVVRAEDGKFLSQREKPKLALVVPRLPTALLECATVPLEEGSTFEISAPGMTPINIPIDLKPSQLRTIKVWEWTGQVVDVGEEAAAWFTQFMGLPCRLVRYVGSALASQVDTSTAADGGVPTVRLAEKEFAEGQEVSLSDGYPLLLASESSLSDLNSRIQAQSPSDPTLQFPLTINRFRPNLVVSGLAPWAEDQYRLVTVKAGGGAEAIPLMSVKPCSRCQVPTINPLTAEKSAGEPSDTLATFRTGSALNWSVKSWKYAVHFGWNVIPLPEAIGKVISVGNAVEFSQQQVSW